MNMRNTIASILLTIVAAIVAVHYLATWYGWYYSVWWLDIPLHAMGGAFIGVLFFYLFRARHNVLENVNTIPFIILGVGFVATIGIVWEFYEFWTDVWLLHKYAADNFPGWVHGDTLLDLLNDMLGGAVAIAALQLLTCSRRNR